MLLYHGSERIIEKPVFMGGRPNNDYGYGFYCTEYPDLAREWSVSEGRSGYLNCYELDDKGLRLLDLNDHTVMNWLAILLANRTFTVDAPLAYEAKKYILKEFMIDYEGFDLIKGYRADDSYFSFARDFISGVISYEQLSEAMMLGDLGNQIVLKSEESFKRIKWLSAEEVSKDVWFPKREIRDRKAREKYYSMDKIKYVKGALYVTRVLDEEIKNNDERL